MKKTLRVLALVVILSLSMVFCAVAADDTIKVAINDSYIDFTDATPIAMNGRTMVPVRAMFEALGAEVGYDANTKVVTATFPDGSIMTLTVGSTGLTVTPKGGKPVTTVMDVEPWVNTTLNRTYIPARFVAEATGLDVNWDSTNRIVHVTDWAALAAEFNKNFTVMNELNTVSGKLPAGKSMSVDMSMDIAVDGEQMSMAFDLCATDAAMSGSLDITSNIPGMEKISTALIANLETNKIYLELNDLAPLMGMAFEGGNVWGSLDFGLLVDPAMLALSVEQSDITIGEALTMATAMIYTEDMGMSPTTFATFVNDVAVTVYGDDVVKKTVSGTKTTYAFASDMGDLMAVAHKMAGEPLDANVTGSFTMTYVVNSGKVADMTMNLTMNMPDDGVAMKFTAVLGNEKPLTATPAGAVIIDMNDLLGGISPMPMLPVEEASDADDTTVQLTAATTYKNEYFGVNVTVPAGWWMYELNEENMSTKSGVTSSLSTLDISRRPGYQYLDVMYYANLKDSTRDNHTDFYLLIEKVDGINTLLAFVEDDTPYVVGTDDAGYTTKLLKQENFSISGNSGIFREFEVTHDDYVTYYIAKYTTSLKDGYFISVEVAFYETNSNGYAIIEEQLTKNIKLG